VTSLGVPAHRGRRRLGRRHRLGHQWRETQAVSTAIRGAGCGGSLHVRSLQASGRGSPRPGPGG
jgi:hypothetical protein